MTMKAIGYADAGPISAEDALIEFDMDAQHLLLSRVADLLDDGTLIPTVNRHGGTLSVGNLRSAHELQESGTAIGKTVLDGF